MTQSPAADSTNSNLTGVPPLPGPNSPVVAPPQTPEASKLEMVDPPAVTDLPPESNGQQDGESSRPVPPPPPPRSTPVPVRKPPVADPAARGPAVPTGVGSAKLGRWRGDVQIEPDGNLATTQTSMRPPAAVPPPPVAEEESLPEEAEDELDEDVVVRSAPPWLISTIVHLILLLVLALITTPPGEGLSNLMLEFGESQDGELEEFDDFVIEPVQLEAQEEMQTDPQPIAEVPIIVEVPVVAPEVTDNVVVNDLGPKISVAAPMFNGRSGAMKQALMAKYGGTQQTQEAVELGLEWLKRQQRKDGCWSMMGPYDKGGFDENKIAATAMAVIAFLGNGDTHKTGKYQQEVDKGLGYLVAQQGRDGYFCKSVRRQHDRAYAQAQATIALCEAYAMTKDSWLRRRCEAAIDYAFKAQSPRLGGWRYVPRIDSDLSVTGWYVMAIQSARAAGLEIQDSKLRDVNRFLDSVESFDGAAYAYTPGRPPSPAMTAEGLLCRQYLGWQRNDPAMVLGVSTLVEDEYIFDIRNKNAYYWYYGTQVLHHYGDSPWRMWNSIMREELPEAQIKRGAERGSWAPHSDVYGSSEGRLYQTCMSIYCLEVYYRHMPLYQ